MSANLPDLKELFVEADNDEGWQPMATPGCFVKTLWHNEQTGASYALVRFTKGSGVPISHIHASNQMMYCLRGKYEYTATNIVITPGCFYMNPKDHPHGPTFAHEDSVLFELYDGPHYYDTPAFAEKAEEK